MSSVRPWEEVKLLDSGRCEPLKATVHGVLFATVAVCAAYNTAAWLKRRQRHLAINAVIYGAALVWERGHIIRHLTACSTRPIGELTRAPGGVEEQASDAPAAAVPAPTPQNLSDAA